jgi:hypothetical protein
MAASTSHQDRADRRNFSDQEKWVEIDPMMASLSGPADVPDRQSFLS